MVLLLALLLAPVFIDWTSYRADFEREASKLLGRPVKVAGVARARILPFPSLSFSNVRVGEDVENPVLTIEQFSMNAELAPFLSGEVLIYDMRVTKPRGVVVMNKDGSINWALRSHTLINPRNVRIENMVVEDGQFELVDEGGGRTHTLVVRQAQISAKALIGPWRMLGMAEIDGAPVHLAVTTGQVEKGVLPLRLSAIGLSHGVLIEADGSVRSSNGKGSYAGQFTLRPAVKSDYALAKIDGNGTRLSDAAFNVTGKFGLAPTGLAFPEFKLETGERESAYIANGSGAVIFGASPRFDLKLNGAQVNIGEDASGNKAGTVAAGGGLTSRIDTLQRFIRTIPMPDMDGNLDVSVPAISVGETTMRDVAFIATRGNRVWRVRDFQAALPGRTQLEADGLLKGGDDFGFVGKLLVASNQPDGLADWLTGRADLQLRKLKAIGFSAEVDLSADAQSFDHLELALGDTVLTGRAHRRTDGERPVLALTLNGGALDFDSLQVFASGFFGVDGENQFAGQDINLTLDTGPVVLSGIEAAKVGLSLRKRASAIEIDRLMLTNIAGASVSATGKINELGEAFSGALDASLVSTNGGEFVAMLAQKMPDNSALQSLATRVDAVPDMLGDLNSTLIFSTAKTDSARAFTVSLNAKTAGGLLTFAANAKGADAASLAGSLRGTVKADDPLTLVALTGLPLIPLGAPGPGVVDFSATGDLKTGLVTSAKFDAPDTDADFDGTVTLGTAGLTASGKMSLASVDFDPYLTAAGLAFSGVGTGTQLRVKAGVAADANGVSLQGLSGDVNDNSVRGDLAVKFAERPVISGSIQAARLDLIWFAENLFGMGAFDRLVANAGPVEFSTLPVAPFDGRVAFMTNTFALGPLGEAVNAKGVVDLMNRAVMLDNFSASYLGGVLMASLDMRNDGGTGTINGNFTLQGGKSAEVERLSSISGEIDITGSMTGTGETAEDLMTGLTGSGIASLRDAVVAGINPRAFTPIFVNAEAFDGPLTLSEVERLMAAPLAQGRFPILPDNLPWSIAEGKLRLSGIKGEASGALMNAELEADIVQGTASVEGKLTYDAGIERVVGAEPVVPFVAVLTKDQSSFTVDAQPMLQFLTQNALEREQARVEALQSALIEKQRLRRDVRSLGRLYSERDQRERQREDALHASLVQKAADEVAQKAREKALLEEAARARVKAKAISEEGKLLIKPELPNNGAADDVFKSFQLDLN